MMRKTLIALGLFTIVNLTPIQSKCLLMHNQKIQPTLSGESLLYKRLKQNIPHAKIIDYLHEGSETKGDSTIEKFKLWLKDGDHEFGVFVRIEYITATEKVIAINFQETSR